MEMPLLLFSAVFRAKSLPEPMMAYSQLDPQEWMEMLSLLFGAGFGAKSLPEPMMACSLLDHQE